MSVTLNFHVCHQNITRADSCSLVADSLNYAYAHFDFCSSDWDGLIKTAVFTRGQDTYEQILEDNQCLIPWEVLPDGKGIFTVSVFAGNRITTNTVKVKLDASGWSFALESSQPPTEDVYSQILTRLADVEDTVVESAESAAQSATSAAESAQSAEQSMEAAQTAKTAAQEAAASVTQYSKTAESWAVGGTGTRTGEDTDNAKYYAEQAGAASQTAVSAGNTATGAAQAATQAAGSASQSAQTAAKGAQIVQELYNGAVSDITAAKTAAVGAIQTKGDEVLDSIPADYTDLSDDVTALKADLSDVETAVEKQIPLDIDFTGNNNKYWNSESTVAVLLEANGYYAAHPINVTPGTKYIVSIWSGTSNKQHPLLFVDANNTILAAYRGMKSETNIFEVRAPEGATYALLTTQGSAHWGATSIAEVAYIDVSEIESNVSEIESNVSEIETAIGSQEVSLISDLETGWKYWDITGDTVVLSTYSGYKAYKPIDVNAGQTYYAHIFVASSAKQKSIVFVDADYHLLAGYSGDTKLAYADFEMVAPENAVYALITTQKSGGVFYPATFWQTVWNSLPDVIEDVENIKKTVEIWEYLKGKTVAILGDSISTNGNPESGPYPNAVEVTVEEADVGVDLSAYLTYYDVNAGLTLGGHTFTSEEIGTEVAFTPTAEDVGKRIGLPLNYNNNNLTVWWEVAAEKLGFTPIPVCWSGSSLSSHEGDKEVRKTSYAWHDAQIRKCGIRTPGTMNRTAPDVIIIYRGTNDFSHSPRTKLTQIYPPYADLIWTYPDTDVLADGYGYKEAICVLVKKLREAYPNAVIYLCTLNVFKRDNYDHFPTNNGINTLPEYNDAIRQMADLLGVNLIEFDKDGITFENCYSGGYITDSATTPTHPSDKGHAVMGKRAVADLKATYVPIN